jgi:hypothetical protein
MTCPGNGQTREERDPLPPRTEACISSIPLLTFFTPIAPIRLFPAKNCCPQREHLPVSPFGSGQISGQLFRLSPLSPYTPSGCSRPKSRPRPLACALRALIGREYLWPVASAAVRADQILVFAAELQSTAVGAQTSAAKSRFAAWRKSGAAPRAVALTPSAAWMACARSANAIRLAPQRRARTAPRLHLGCMSASVDARLLASAALTVFVRHALRQPALTSRVIQGSAALTATVKRAPDAPTIRAPRASAALMGTVRLVPPVAPAIVQKASAALMGTVTTALPRNAQTHLAPRASAASMGAVRRAHVTPSARDAPSA